MCVCEILVDMYHLFLSFIYVGVFMVAGRVAYYVEVVDNTVDKCCHLTIRSTSSMSFIIMKL